MTDCSVNPCHAVAVSVPRPLIIVGAGGFSRETAEAVRAINQSGATPAWDLLGFVDDDPSLHGREILGVEVLGALEVIAGIDAQVVLGLGTPSNPRLRQQVAERLAIENDRLATIVHPGASVARSSSIGPGSVLLANVALTADVTVGRCVTVMPAVTLTHDVVVENYASITAGCALAGGVRVGESAYLGAMTTIREHVTVGAGSMTGMGSVVLTDIPPRQLWLGCPAKHFRDL